MTCQKCGWPVRVTRTKKILTKRVVSLTCTNRQCKGQRTLISS